MKDPDQYSATQQRRRTAKHAMLGRVTGVVAILLLGGEPERDTFAAELAFDFSPPLEVFASSPSAGAEERLRRLDKIGKLVLSHEASAMLHRSIINYVQFAIAPKDSMQVCMLIGMQEHGIHPLVFLFLHRLRGLRHRHELLDDDSTT